MWDEQSDDDKSFILDQSRITQYENDGQNDSEDLKEEQKNYEYDNNNILSQIQNNHSQQYNYNHQSYNQNNQDYQTPGGQEAPQQGHIINNNNFNQNVNQQQNKVVNVGDLISMDEKINEYKNESIRQKLEEIKQLFPNFRKIRGDGNCFFRAFAFAYFDKITKDKNQNKFNQLLKNIRDTDYSLIKNKPEEIQNEKQEGIIQNIINSLIYIREKKSQQSMLQQQMNQVCGYDFYIVSFIKLQSYEYFKSNEQVYQPFQTNEEDAEKNENIYLQWGTEAEGIPIQTTALKFDIILNIHQQDRDQYNCPTYNEELLKKYTDQSLIPIVIDLFFRPGHYDLFEKKVESETQQTQIVQKEQQNNQINEQKQHKNENIQTQDQLQKQNYQKNEDIFHNGSFKQTQNINSVNQQNKNASQLKSVQISQRQENIKVQTNNFIRQREKSPTNQHHITQPILKADKIENVIQSQRQYNQQKEEEEENKNNTQKQQLLQQQFEKNQITHNTQFEQQNVKKKNENLISPLSQNQTQEYKQQNEKQNLEISQLKNQNQCLICQSRYTYNTLQNYNNNKNQSLKLCPECYKKQQNQLNIQVNNQNLTNQYDKLNYKNQVMKNQVFEKYDEEEKKQSFENQIKCKSCNKFTPFEDKLYCTNCICSLCGENTKTQNSAYCQKCLCYQCKFDSIYKDSIYCKQCIDKNQNKKYDVYKYSNKQFVKSKIQQQQQQYKHQQELQIHNQNQKICQSCQYYDKELGKQYCNFCLCRTCKSKIRISDQVQYCKDCVCESCQKQSKKLNKNYCEICLCYNCKSNPKYKNEIFCLECITCKNCKKQKKRQVNDTFCQDCLCNNCSKEVKLQGQQICQNCLKKYFCQQCKNQKKYQYKDFCVNCICIGCQKEKKENGQNKCYNCIQKQYCVQCKRNYKQKYKDTCMECESKQTQTIPTASQNAHFQQVNKIECNHINQNQRSTITGQIVAINNYYQDPNKIYYYDSKLKNPQSLQVHNLQNNNLQKKEVHTFLNGKSLPQIEQPRLTNCENTPTQNIDTNEKNNQNAIKDKCTFCKKNKKKKNDQICQKCIEAYRKQRGVNEISIWNDKKCNICQKMDKRQNDDRGICCMCFRDFSF